MKSETFTRLSRRLGWNLGYKGSSQYFLRSAQSRPIVDLTKTLPSGQLSSAFTRKRKMSGEGEISLKRVKKTKCSDLENVTLLEEIEKEKDLLTSHFQNGVTLKRKEMLWKHIADSVNAIGGNGRSVGQVKKRWKDMKSAVIDRQRQRTKTGGGCPLQDIQYEDIIRRIIGETW